MLTPLQKLYNEVKDLPCTDETFKTKVIELAEKKGVIPFPFARGFHPQLTLFREISSMQVRSSIQTTSAHL